MRKSFVMTAVVALALSSPAVAQDQGTLEEKAGVAGSGTSADYGVVEDQDAAGQDGTLELDTGMAPEQGVTGQGTVDPDTMSEGVSPQETTGQGATGQGGQALEEEGGAGTVDAEGIIPGGVAGGDTNEPGDAALGNQGQGGSAAGGSAGSSGGGGSTGGSAGGGSSGGGGS